MTSAQSGLWRLSHDLVCILNADGGFVELSPSWQETTGFKSEALLQKDFIDYVHPDDRTVCLQSLSKGTASIQGDVTFRLRHLDGSYLWIQWRFAAEADGLVLACGKDITQTLKSQTRLAHLERGARIGTWEIDLETQSLHWSDETHRIHETDPRTYKPDLDDGLRFYHPSSIPTITLAVETMMTTGAGFDLKLRFVTAAGRLIWVRSIARAEMRDGKVVRCYGSFQDITFEEEQQQRIREAKERFDVVVNNIPVMLSLFDEGGTFEWVNEAWTRELGWELQSMAGRDMLAEFYPDPDYRKTVADFMLNARPGFRDLITRRRDGTQLHTSRGTVRLSNGKIIAIGQNVSARRTAESELKQARIEIEKFFSISVDMLCVAGTDGHFKRVNPAFTDILGYDAEELLSRPYIDFVHPDDHAITAKESDRVSVPHGSHVFENRYRTKDGNFRILSWLSSMDPETGFIYASARDVTREREAERDLKQVMSALDQSATVAVTDRDGTILSANQRFADVSGYTLLEILGQNHRMVSSGAHGKAFFGEMWQTLRSGQVWTGEIQNRRKDGEPYWVQTCISPLFDSVGEIDRFISIQFDVTARKTAQIHMLQSAKMASLGEMAGGIAHEVNNPLSIIKGKSEQILRIIDEEDLDLVRLRRDISKIAATAERIAKIVRGLRTFSRDSEREPLEPFSLKQIIEESLDLCRERLRAHDVEIRLRIDNDVMIDCRSVQIGQVLLNLLSNAHDAIHNHTERWIEVAAETRGDGIRITVTDSGRGISGEIAQKMMQPFFTTKEVGKGTGLGLSISKGIVEQHGGRLFYEPESSHTCFVIELPTPKLGGLAA